VTNHDEPVQQANVTVYGVPEDPAIVYYQFSDVFGRVTFRLKAGVYKILVQHETLGNRHRTVNLIHSGPWNFEEYETAAYILLTANKLGSTYNTGLTDPNWIASTPVTSTNGFFRYYRDEDLNKDDKVNILDAILLAGKFGWPNLEKGE